MARDYARIVTAIWRNEEFRSLEESAQRLYLLLVTQPDISAAGVLALRVRRWADMSRDSTAEGLVGVLKELEAGRFVVVDWEAEELLVCSFIRWDGGFNNRKRRPAILAAVGEVGSQVIVRHLVVELQRCGITLPSDSPPDSLSGAADSDVDSLSGSPSGATSTISDVVPGHQPLPQVDSLSDGVFSGTPLGITNHDRGVGSFPQVDSLSDRLPDSPRLVSSKDEYGINLKNRRSKPTNASRSRSVAAPRPDPPADPPAEPTAQALVAEWITECRRRPPSAVIGHTSKVIKQLLDDGLDPDDIRHGITLWAQKGLHPSVLPAVVNELMNSTMPRRKTNRTTDDKVADWQRLKSLPPPATTYELPRGEAS
jgi:hypothetical protein